MGPDPVLWGEPDGAVGRSPGTATEPSRNYLKTLDYARNLVKAKNYDGVKAAIGECTGYSFTAYRTAFIPSSGNKFVVADFSAIEAQVIAWLAGGAVGQ